MMQSNTNQIFFRLPEKTELALFLICEDLKSTKFFNTLANVGLDDNYYQSHFAGPVLAYSGFPTIPDDLLVFYLELIERHSNEIDAGKDAITTEAFNVYVELMLEKRKRNISDN